MIRGFDVSASVHRIAASCRGTEMMSVSPLAAAPTTHGSVQGLPSTNTANEPLLPWLFGSDPREPRSAVLERIRMCVDSFVAFSIIVRQPFSKYWAFAWGEKPQRLTKLLNSDFLCALCTGFATIYGSETTRPWPNQPGPAVASWPPSLSTQS